MGRKVHDEEINEGAECTYDDFATTIHCKLVRRGFQNSILSVYLEVVEVIAPLGGARDYPVGHIFHRIKDISKPEDPMDVRWRIYAEVESVPLADLVRLGQPCDYKDIEAKMLGVFHEGYTIRVVEVVSVEASDELVVVEMMVFGTISFRKDRPELDLPAGATFSVSQALGMPSIGWRLDKLPENVKLTKKE